MTTGKKWDDYELGVITQVYVAMLHMERVAKTKFNKAAIRRGTLPLLDGRSAGSYEMKMCNISAAMRDAGEPWVIGYKPLAGYQRSLKVIAAGTWHGMTTATARDLIERFTEAGALK